MKSRFFRSDLRELMFSNASVSFFLFSRGMWPLFVLVRLWPSHVSFYAGCQRNSVGPCGNHQVRHGEPLIVLFRVSFVLLYSRFLE